MAMRKCNSSVLLEASAFHDHRKVSLLYRGNILAHYNLPIVRKYTTSVINNEIVDRLRRNYERVETTPTIQTVCHTSNFTTAIPFGNDAHGNSIPFIQEILTFLERDGIPYRYLDEKEVSHVLHSYSQNSGRSSTSIQECLSIWKHRHILSVGKIHEHSNQTQSASRHANFILHLCPTLTLNEIKTLYQEHCACQSVSTALASFAWMNAHLTNAFLTYSSDSRYSKQTNTDQQLFDSMAVCHLHQDVWNRSPQIVQSRLRNKCGLYRTSDTVKEDHGRIFARQTTVKRVSKSEYVPFLENNHLWGATTAKYGFGLYVPCNNKMNSESDGGSSEQCLVAVATFSAKRKIRRSSREFHSYELQRFCTKMNTTVVGGLTKLVSAFVRSVRKIDNDIEIDIITSIDRDFGYNQWPHFERMEVMAPIPMFIGETDGIRRHAVGASLVPLEQLSKGREQIKMSQSELLRAGLPTAVMSDLQQCSANDDKIWEIIEQHGFHPVFDAGVERLMWVIKNVDSSQSKTLAHKTRDSFCDAPLSVLWEQSVPRYVTQHYSPNQGIMNILDCIQRNS